MWYICYDRKTGEVRRVIELSSDEKANAITKYRVEKAETVGNEKPDVEVIPMPYVPSPEKTGKERMLETLGLAEEDLINIKKIPTIESDVDKLKEK